MEDGSGCDAVDGLGNLLQQLLGSDILEKVNRDDLEKLVAADYTDEEAIKYASREGLVCAGLRPGKVDFLVHGIRSGLHEEPIASWKHVHALEVARHCRRFVGRTEQNASVTVVSKTLLATYCHGDHLSWVIGSIVKVFFDSDQIFCTVFAKHRKMDFCLLRPNEPMDFEPRLASAAYGQFYIVLGHSGPDFSTESVTTGVIAAKTWDMYGHILGSSGYGGGDSGSSRFGGGIFSVPGGELVGVNVGCGKSDSSTMILGKDDIDIERRKAHIIPILANIVIAKRISGTHSFDLDCRPSPSEGDHDTRQLG